MYQELPPLLKYPRTRHIEGSRLSPGDEDLSQVLLRELPVGELIWEVKLDGASTAISFDAAGNLLTQSRGHYLLGGDRQQFGPFKAWAAAHAHTLWPVLGAKFIVYGEWCYAKHSVFYDQLPHYFHEFDIYDRERKEFLSTERRHALLADLPIVSVPVIEPALPPRNRKAMEALIGPSIYVGSSWGVALDDVIAARGLDRDLTILQTDMSGLEEGLYVKQERDGVVIDRFKYVRRSFVQVILDSESHTNDRPILHNQLAAGIDLYSPHLDIDKTPRIRLD